MVVGECSWGLVVGVMGSNGGWCAEGCVLCVGEYCERGCIREEVLVPCGVLAWG